MGTYEKESNSIGVSLNKITFVLATLVLTACGGAVKRRVDIKVPEGYQLSRTASLNELLELINDRYAFVQTLS